VKMTREQLFAAPKVVRRGEERIEQGKVAVRAARARATEIAQQAQLAAIGRQGQHVDDGVANGTQNAHVLGQKGLGELLGEVRAGKQEPRCLLEGRPADVGTGRS
jgi:hypothetical protein